MKKRGFAISFQWIFAIIAGVIIFSFLINFGYQQIALNTKSTSLESISNLESQLTTLSTSNLLDTEIETKSTITFTCNDIILDKNKLSTEKIIFSPAPNQDKLNIWLKSWNYPFKITDFYYISNDKFYLFNPPTLEIPARFNVLKNPTTFSKDSLFIFFNQPTQNQVEEALKYSKNIKIIDTTTKLITFYPDKTTYYTDDNFLYAAIFSKDYETYICLQQKTLENLKLITDLYKEKAIFLQRDFPTCGYSEIASTLEQFKTNLALKDKIITQNSLLKQNDCPELY